MKDVSLPQNWKIVQIKDIARVNSGQGAPQGEKCYNGKNIFVKAGDLNNLTDQKYVGEYGVNITDEAVNKYKLRIFPKNSIVFPKSGMSVKTDNIALLKHDSHVVNHLAILEITDLSICYPFYLYYFLKRVKISNLSLNESYPSIRLTDINLFKVILPPIETQKKIVEILEKAENLKEWRAEADELADEYLKSVFLEMFGDLYKNENRWDEYLLNDLIEIPLNSGWSPNCSDEKGGLPVFSLANLDGNTLKTNITKYYYGENPKKGFDLKKGDLLISRSNTRELVGRVGLYNGKPEKVLYPDLMIRIRLNKELNPVFFEKYLQSETTMKSIRKFAHGTSGSMVKISQKNLGKLKIIVPPLTLQNQFAQIVQQVETLKTHQAQSKQEIDNLFNTLMQKAFKGELVC